MNTKRIHGVARLRATFAANLRQAMLTKGMSQSDVARAVWQDERTDKKGFVQPVGKDRISAYVNGKVLPTEETLGRIARALDTTPEKLLGEREPSAGPTAAQHQPTQHGLITLQYNLQEKLIIIEVKYAARPEHAPLLLRDFQDAIVKHQEKDDAEALRERNEMMHRVSA
jgi:transcriptional regulator with XRE-family HTH domain